MSQRSVHTIWCDDIRQELGNKPSFVGVYTGGIVLLGFPTVLPRLGVWTTVRSSTDRHIREVSVRVERDDGTILLELAKGAVQPAGVRRAGEHATSQVLMFGATIAAPLDGAPKPNVEKIDSSRAGGGAAAENPSKFIGFPNQARFLHGMTHRQPARRDR